MIGCVAGRHGTAQAYRAGCRCDDAREAIRVEKAAYRRRLYLAGAQLVDRTGTIRRVQALARLGWPVGYVKQQAGFGRSTDLLDPSRAIRRDHATRVEAIYDRLSMTVGPSRRAALRAQRLGWPPPLAWDDDQLDDPSAQPYRACPPRQSWDAARWADLDHLLAAGLTLPQAAARLGIGTDALRKAVRRRTRADSDPLPATDAGEHPAPGVIHQGRGVVAV